MEKIRCYKPKSNITTSISVKQKDEQDYLALRHLLQRNRISVGEYLIDAYRELDKEEPNTKRLRTIAWSWDMNLTHHHKKLINSIARKRQLSESEYLLLLLLEEYKVAFNKDYNLR